MVSPRRALFSVSDKEGLVDFARGLHALGFELMGTEGTAKTLKDAGLPVTTVADYTGLHEGLGGRVKTLHAKIFAGILAPRGDERDLADLGAVAIYNYLAKRQGTVLPPALRLAYDKVADLRYGENPYQKAALYHEPFPFAATATAEKLQGKDLSYNNLIDLDAALRLATEFDRPAAVVIKHTNPSGVALASSLTEAYANAHAADPISAYGGVVGLNRPVDLATAKAMRKDVLDAVIAPEYEPQALDLLKSKKKGTYLILRTRRPFRNDHGIDMVRVLGV